MSLRYLYVLLLGVSPPIVSLGLGIIYFSLLLATTIVFCFFLLPRRGAIIARHDVWSLYPLWLMVYFGLLSAIWAINPSAAIIATIKLFVFVLISFGAIQLFKNNIERWFFLLATVSSLAVMGVFLWLYVVYGSIRLPDLDVSKSIGSFSNFGSSIIVLSVPFFLHQNFVAKKHKTIAMVLFVASLLALAFSASRAGFGLSIAYLAYFLIRSKSLKMVFVVGSLILFSSLGVFFLNVDLSGTTGLLIDRVHQDIESDNRDEALRTIALNETANIFINMFPLGVGFNNFYYHMETKSGHAIISHSVISTMFGELGLMGFLVFILYIQKMARAVSANRKTEVNPLLGAAVLGTIYWLVRPMLDNFFYFLLVASVFSGKHILYRKG